MTAEARSVDLMTVAEVAGLLRKPVSWVYRAAASGEIPTTRIGVQLRFRRTAIDAWLDQRTTPGPGDRK